MIKQRNNGINAYTIICLEVAVSPLSPGRDVMCIRSADEVMSLVSLDGVRG